MKRFTMKAVSLGIVMCVGLSPLSAAPLAKVANEGNISGFFLGAELGYSATFQKTTTQETGVAATVAQDNNFPFGNVGVKLGYTHFFNNWVGIRGYANYHYGFLHNNNDDGTAKSTTLSSYHQVAGNVEATFKFFDLNGVGLGAYAGLGAGYATANSISTTTEAATATTTDTKIASGFVLPVNIGLEVYMGKHHNASLNFRIPTIATTQSITDTAGGTTTKDELRNLIITLGYSYTF